MRYLLKNIFHGSRGFTLMEVLVGMAISAVIIMPMAVAVGELEKIYQSNTDDLCVIRNLDSAGARMVIDIQSAQSPLPGAVTLTPGAGDTLTLTQSVVSPSDCSAVYSISADGDLQRTVGGNTSIIASHIVSVVYYAGSPLEINITASYGTATVTRTFNTISRIK